MPKSEALNLSADDTRLAKIFRALGNPTRLAILQHLAGCQPCPCANIVADLPLAQSTVSQHLKVLKEAGLIIGEPDGPAVCYCIDTDNLVWFKKVVSELPW